MKVTVILEPDNSKVAITVCGDTATLAPMKPTLLEVTRACYTATDECLDRAMVLGFIQ